MVLGRFGTFRWIQESSEADECEELLRALGVHEPGQRHLPWVGTGTMRLDTSYRLPVDCQQL